MVHVEGGCGGVFAWRLQNGLQMAGMVLQWLRVTFLELAQPEEGAPWE